jgi:hypothetical protein
MILERLSIVQQGFPSRAGATGQSYKYCLPHMFTSPIHVHAMCKDGSAPIPPAIRCSDGSSTSCPTDYPVLNTDLCFKVREPCASGLQLQTVATDYGFVPYCFTPCPSGFTVAVQNTSSGPVVYCTLSTGALSDDQLAQLPYCDNAPPALLADVCSPGDSYAPLVKPLACPDLVTTWPLPPGVDYCPGTSPPASPSCYDPAFPTMLALPGAQVACYQPSWAGYGCAAPTQLSW